MSARRTGVWATLLTLGLAYEITQLRAGDDGVPLSKVIRRTYRTDTDLGRTLFVLSVEQGSAWLTRHILAVGSTTTTTKGTTT